MPARSETDGVIELALGAFRLGVLPRLGGSITHLTWTRPGGGPGNGEVELMRRATVADIASGNPSRLASFTMVPFTNRIDGGRMSFANGQGGIATVHLPINRPAQNAAIHGFGRLAPWSVSARTAGQIELAQDFAEPGNPYRYDAKQTFVLAPGHVACHLSVTNRGDAAMPFGIGFHPWFDRTPAATLAFSAINAFRMDDRDMPLEAIAVGGVTGGTKQSGDHAFGVANRTPFDTPISGWKGTATLTWPERRTALDLQAFGDFRLVHIFSPKEPAVFCVEPVSHLPDVINRRHLASHGDMKILKPGESMTGEMRLVPRGNG
jgi:aldose 1-epimerase